MPIPQRRSIVRLSLALLLASLSLVACAQQDGAPEQLARAIPTARATVIALRRTPSPAQMKSG